MIKKIVCTLLTGIILTTSLSDIYANEKFTLEHVNGSNAHILKSINEKAFKKSDEAIIINENASIDAISATPLAYLKDAPIITTPWLKMSKDNIDYIKKLGVKKITIVGGLKNVSKTIEVNLADMGIEVDRIYGQDRYDTSMKIVEAINKEKKVSKVILMSSLSGLENSISVADFACKNNMPIIWANDNQIETTAEFVNKQNYEKVYVVGNDEKFGNNVAQHINNIEPIKEINKYDTNVEYIKELYDDVDSIYTVNIEYGNNSDITKYLSLPVAAAKQNIPILVCNKNFSYSQEEFIKENIETVIEVGDEVGNYDILNTFKSSEFLKAMIIVAVVIIILVRGFKA